MGLDLSTLKRGNHLLQEQTNNSKKKIGRKKIEDETIKYTEKVVTYLTKSQKANIEKICKEKNLNLAQYFRLILIENSNINNEEY
jgi:hypothetical protein